MLQQQRACSAASCFRWTPTRDASCAPTSTVLHRSCAESTCVLVYCGLTFLILSDISYLRRRSPVSSFVLTCITQRTERFSLCAMMCGVCIVFSIVRSRVPSTPSRPRPVARRGVRPDVRPPARPVRCVGHVAPHVSSTGTTVVLGIRAVNAMAMQVPIGSIIQSLARLTNSARARACPKHGPNQASWLLRAGVLLSALTWSRQRCPGVCALPVARNRSSRTLRSNTSRKL